MVHKRVFSEKQPTMTLHVTSEKKMRKQVVQNGALGESFGMGHVGSFLVPVLPCILCVSHLVHVLAVECGGEDAELHPETEEHTPKAKVKKAFHASSTSEPCQPCKSQPLGPSACTSAHF